LPRFGPLSSAAVARIVKANGFEFDRSAEHGDIYRRVADRRWTTIPRATQIGIPLFKLIQKQTGKPREDFLRLR